MTRAQELNITDFPYKELDSRGNVIYEEDSYTFWVKTNYDKNNNPIYIKNHKGGWYKRTFDERNNPTYYKDYEGNEEIVEYNNENYPTYFRNEKNQWERYDYDERTGKIISYINSVNVWWKRSFDRLGRQITFEDMDGNYWESNMHIKNPYLESYYFGDEE